MPGASLLLYQEVEQETKRMLAARRPMWVPGCICFLGKLLQSATKQLSLRNRTFILSQFWRVEFQDQGVSGARFPRWLVGRILLCFSLPGAAGDPSIP